MSDREKKPPGAYTSGKSSRSLRLGRIRGIEICLDPSLAIIFALLVSLLALSFFPNWHPEWGAGVTWLTAFITGVLFFISILLHELAHSLVAIHFGIRVPRITLFLFGGVAEIEEEPDSPRVELLVALAGPATSLALGMIFIWLAAQMAGPEFLELSADDPAAVLSTLSPLPTLLLWLGPINILLGLFNLVPGFPLDGGRVLRALIWWITGDLYRATRIAAAAGRLFGTLLIVLGILQTLTGLFLQGLWLLMIGWFLSSSAVASYRQLVVRDLLKGVTARDMMRSRFNTVATNLPVAEFIDQHLLQSPQILWPVVENEEELVGLITLAEVKAVPAKDRGDIRIGQVMRTDLPAHSLAPDTAAAAALQALTAHELPMAVVEKRRVIGLISQPDAMKWLLLHQQ